MAAGYEQNYIWSGRSGLRPAVSISLMQAIADRPQEDPKDSCVITSLMVVLSESWTNSI